MTIEAGAGRLRKVSDDQQPLSTSCECHVYIYAEEDGGYSICASRLPGAASQGETIEEAIANFREAFQGLAEFYASENRPVPWTQCPDPPESADVMERWVRVDG